MLTANTFKLNTMKIQEIGYSFLFSWFFCSRRIIQNIHCVKSVCIRSFSSSFFSAFGLNADQKNSECGHISRSNSHCAFYLEMWSNPQFPVDLVTLTEKIFNGKLYFFVQRHWCSLRGKLYQFGILLVLVLILFKIWESDIRE